MDSLDKLLALITAANTLPKPLTRTNVTFSNVAVVVGNPAANTSATMTGVGGQGYAQSVTIQWRRINLAALVNGTGLLDDGNMTAQDVVDRVNENWGLWLTLDDLAPFNPPDTSDGEIHDLVLTAQSGSLGFFGTVTLSLSRPSMSVFNTLMNQTLPGIFAG